MTSWPVRVLVAVEGESVVNMCERIAAVVVMSVNKLWSLRPQAGEEEATWADDDVHGHLVEVRAGTTRREAPGAAVRAAPVAVVPVVVPSLVDAVHELAPVAPAPAEAGPRIAAGRPFVA